MSFNTETIEINVDMGPTFRILRKIREDGRYFSAIIGVKPNPKFINDLKARLEKEAINGPA